MANSNKKTLHGFLTYYRNPDLAGDDYTVFQDQDHIAPNGDYLESGIQSIGDGDRLTVFNDAAKKQRLWSGTIRYKKGNKTPKGIQPNTWRSFFKKNLPATLKKNL